MGLDIYLHAVMGVRVERVQKNRFETKYNPDTGKPYEKAIPYKVHEIVGTDIEIPDVYTDAVQCCDYERDDERFYGVELPCTKDARSHRWDGLLSITIPDDLTEFRQQAKELLDKLGYTGPIALHVFNHYSY